MKKKTNWLELIKEEMADKGDSMENLVESTMTQEEMTKPFDDGFGSPEGIPFTLWTRTRVYFPLVYDGSEWVGSVPRDPCNEKSTHKGGY